MILQLDQFKASQRYYLMSQTLVPRPVAWVLSENAGGSYNLDQPIELQVSHLGQDTVLSGIRRLIEQASSPHQLFHKITEDAPMRLHLTRRLLD
jgi:hypothetical protein